jgi:hypothetical protein
MSRRDKSSNLPSSFRTLWHNDKDDIPHCRLRFISSLYRAITLKIAKTFSGTDRLLKSYGSLDKSHIMKNGSPEIYEY